jgi:hypothetical protein
VSIESSESRCQIVTIPERASKPTMRLRGNSSRRQPRKHEEEGAFVVEMILGNLPPVQLFVDLAQVKMVPSNDLAQGARGSTSTCRWAIAFCPCSLVRSTRTR